MTESRSDLIFSYRDPATGAFETATNIHGIPATARRNVVVTDLSRTPEERQAGRYIFVADLRRPRADGTFAVATASRYGFEEQLSGTSTSSLPAGKNVVLYSASWCGVCAKAKRLLAQWGVSYVEKDVEASRSAAAELAAKANRQNVTPSGVPVIDVAGTLLFGLDEQALEDALRQHGFMRPRGP